MLHEQQWHSDRPALSDMRLANGAGKSKNAKPQSDADQATPRLLPI